MKAYYRKAMWERIIELIDGKQGDQANVIAKKTTLLEAVHLVHNAWASVSSQTIQNCFKKGNFTPKEDGIKIYEIVKKDAVVSPKCMSKK